jgi:hypothetical protein
VYVECPATATRGPVSSDGVERREHDFHLPLPAGVPAGHYVVTATAISGIGDGCDPVNQPGEIEKARRETAPLTIS